MHQLDEDIMRRALLWVREQEARALAEGLPLSEREQAIARQAGVREVGRVRLLPVMTMPSPDDVVLQSAMQAARLGLGDSEGLTLGHAILLLSPSAGTSASGWRQEGLVGHELVHVAQVERLGLNEFLHLYLEQCLSVGYHNAPLEREARAFRFDGSEM